MTANSVLMRPQGFCPRTRASQSKWAAVDAKPSGGLFEWPDYWTQGKFSRHLSPLLACLHDQNKSGFFGGPSFIYAANQNNLKRFQKNMIGWEKAGPPKKPLLFW